MDDLLFFIAVGFAAQLVDGAIGMGYGLTGMTMLLSFGITPATASASVHAAEVFTTAASGLSHWRFGNVDRSLVRRLAIPGVIGGVVGAVVLVSAPQAPILVGISVYLFLMGAIILRKAFRKGSTATPGGRQASALGLFGGFFDALGGGGWGPIVTSTLIGHGITPRLAIGSSIAAEFFVATAVSGSFIATIGLDLWPVIAGLVAGGILAAPLAAWLTRRLPDRPLMTVVGVVIMVLSCRQLVLVVAGT